MISVLQESASRYDNANDDYHNIEFGFRPATLKFEDPAYYL